MSEKVIKLELSNNKSIEITENDFMLNVLKYLRENFPKQECVIYEIKHDGKRTSEEGAAAVLSLLRNPQMVNHYNTIVKNKL